ncbi:cupin 2 domain-containing protein [Xylogone sp. PMI_703]|nr:cupin 2 domain-containing protein [Xylogone sp. PMI_703]
MSLPFRRVVTGHSADGKAIITNDDVLTPVSFFDSSKPASPEDFGLTLIFRTENSSTDANASISNTVPFRDPHGTLMPIVEPGHTNWRIIDFPPHSTASMHRTLSVDFGVVLKGEITCELDDKVETVLKEQDGIVQRGTVHAWHNRTGEVTRVLFVLLPAEKIVLQGQPLEIVEMQ